MTDCAGIPLWMRDRQPPKQGPEDPGWRVVSKDEFEAYRAAYPAPLESNVSNICDPPGLSLNDFSAGAVYPQSVVAIAHLYESYPPGSERWKPNVYKLRAAPHHAGR